MSDLERSINQVLEEHRHESGLNVIGGQRQLLNRLVQLFEEELKEQSGQTRSGRDQ